MECSFLLFYVKVRAITCLYPGYNGGLLHLFQLFGEIAIIHFTTVVCHCGLSRITGVHCANKNGLYRRLEDDIQWQVGKYVSTTHILSIFYMYYF